MKSAVICAMCYRMARLAIKHKEWMKAKQSLMIFACNKWTIHRTKSNKLTDRFIEYEKWMKLALKLPFAMDDGREIEQQTKLLRCYAFYIMNVYGDRYHKLETVYQQCLQIDPNDGVTLTYYGKWLLDRPFTLNKAEQCLRKAVEINSGSAVFLNYTINDNNVKNIRFSKPQHAEILLQQCLIKQGKKVADSLRLLYL